MKSKRKNVMEESLKTAAEIRRELEGRHHSDSTGKTLCDFDEILSAALSLPPGEGAMLADHLLVSLDSPNQEHASRRVDRISV